MVLSCKLSFIVHVRSLIKCIKTVKMILNDLMNVQKMRAVTPESN